LETVAFLIGACSVIAMLLRIILSTLASFVVIFALLTLGCYATDHDKLVMLHMYSSPIILSLASGIVLLLSSSNPRALSRSQHERGHHSVDA
jgi:hypothetical protein